MLINVSCFSSFNLFPSISFVHDHIVFLSLCPAKKVSISPQQNKNKKKFAYFFPRIPRIIARSGSPAIKRVAGILEVSFGDRVLRIRSVKSAR